MNANNLSEVFYMSQIKILLYNGEITNLDEEYSITLDQRNENLFDVTKNERNNFFKGSFSCSYGEVKDFIKNNGIDKTSKYLTIIGYAMPKKTEDVIFHQHVIEPNLNIDGYSKRIFTIAFSNGHKSGIEQYIFKDSSSDENLQLNVLLSDFNKSSHTIQIVNDLYEYCSELRSEVK